MVRAGVLRHRVTIQTPATDQDTWGQPIEGWSDVVTNLPAEVRDIRGREFWQQQQAPGGDVNTRVRIRYRTDLERQMRVLHLGRALEIEAIIDPDGRMTELHLMCREAT